MSDFKIVIEKLDRLDRRQDAMEVTMVRNTVTLEEHVRRTNILEEDIKPVKAHVALMNNVAKIVSVVAASAALLKSFGLF